MVLQQKAIMFIENAKKKIKKKNLDYIVANDITAKDTGFA